MSIKSITSESNVNGKNALSTASVLANVEGALTGVSHEFHSFVDDIEHLFKETKSMSGDELEEARARLSERVTAARASVEKIGGSITDQARKSVVAGNKYVHQQPWQIVGAMAALGVLAGLLLARRK